MLPGNWPVWWLYQQMSGMIFNGMGGVDAGSIEAGLRNLNVPAAARPGLYRKLLALAKEILRESKEN